MHSHLTILHAFLRSQRSSDLTNPSAHAVEPEHVHLDPSQASRQWRGSYPWPVNCLMWCGSQYMHMTISCRIRLSYDSHKETQVTRQMECTDKYITATNAKYNIQTYQRKFKRGVLYFNMHICHFISIKCTRSLVKRSFGVLTPITGILSRPLDVVSPA